MADTAATRARVRPAETLPDEGDLVEVRGQNWVVSRVETPANGESGQGGPVQESDPTPAHSLIHLQSVVAGHYGETLSVIWEIEPGRRILPASSLPDAGTGGFDPPERLAAFLDAVRWSAVTLANVKTLQAPFRSGVAVEPYQLEPVARAVEAPRVNLLLADDVGLGKTVEAGLVAQELLLRGRAHRIMVVCPAGLTLKWKDELAEKFGLDFEIIDSAACTALRRTHGTAANPFRVHRRTIVSLSWLRGAKAQRLLDEVLPPDGSDRTEGETGPDGRETTGEAGGARKRFFDLLVLDEAHHVAPAAPKGLYAVDSQQTRLIRRLAPHFEHRLFLSATPHNGYPESFTALLEIIDSQRFIRGMEPDDTMLKGTVVRRLKSEITDADGIRRFRERRTETISVEYTPAEREVHELLGGFATLRRKSLATRARGGRRAADLVTLLLKKRLFSSPAAFLHTVRVYLERLEEDGADTGEGETADDVPLWLEDVHDTFAALDDEDLAAAEDSALGRATRLAPVTDAEALGLLREMERWALTHEAQADSKAAALLGYLRAVCLPDGRHWSRERVVVFTEYRDTQDWLYELLRQEALTDDGRVARLHGGLTTDERETIRLGFQARPESDEGKVRILIATDAASEGIDLQKHCWRLVNYDIPFNPNKLEQRIGRIDRWGQRHDPEIRHFIGTGWQDAQAGSYEADLEFLSRVAKKVARMEADLGSVNAVLADAVQRRMSGDLRPADIEGAAPKPRGNRRRPAGDSDFNVPSEQHVTAQVERLAAQYEQSVDELGITPENVHRVVSTALALDGQQPLRAVTALDPAAEALFADLEDAPDDPAGHDLADLSGSLYEVPPLTGSWERASRGLAHRLRPEHQRPVTFDVRAAAEARDDVVLAHLAHPLVAMSTHLLRTAVWQPDTVGLHRVTAVVSDEAALETTLVGAYASFVLVGKDGTCLHEEILQASGWVGETGWLRRWENVRPQRETLAAALTYGTPAAPYLRQSLAAKWPRIQDPLFASLRARARERQDSMAHQLDQRRQADEQRVNATFDRFRDTLRARLRDEGDAEGEQIAMFGTRELTSAEARQFRDDRQRWQSRLQSLAEERTRELATVADRYGDVRPHLFPVAVVFAIPTKEAEQ